MTLRIGDLAPDFTADSTEGEIRLHEWMGDGWAVLFSHPKDFTPVCTTELGAVAKLKPDFDVRGCKVLGLSIDPVADHRRWARDIEATQGVAPNFPIVGDEDLSVAKRYGMLPRETQADGPRTAADNATVRTVFVIGPDKRIRATIAYPMSTGRNFAEVLRLLDSVRLSASHEVATPADWSAGDAVFILPTVPDAEAKRRYPDGWTAPRPYMRLISQP